MGSGALEGARRATGNAPDPGAPMAGGFVVLPWIPVVVFMVFRSFLAMPAANRSRGRWVLNNRTGAPMQHKTQLLRGGVHLPDKGKGRVQAFPPFPSDNGEF